MRKCKHGMTDTPEWNTWQSMRNRCNTKSAGNYDLYGGRGIKVCDRWNYFKNFFFDMGKKPENHTLDRIDVNGDYSKENCRWATDNQQNRNKRNTKKFLFNGEMLCLIEIAERSNIDYNRFCSRIFKSGWTIENAALIPVKKANTYKFRWMDQKRLEE